MVLRRCRGCSRSRTHTVERLKRRGGYMVLRRCRGCSRTHAVERLKRRVGGWLHGAREGVVVALAHTVEQLKCIIYMVLSRCCGCKHTVEQLKCSVGGSSVAGVVVTHTCVTLLRASVHVTYCYQCAGECHLVL